MDEEIVQKLKTLRHSIRLLGKTIIAYSGGIDSTLVAKIARDELGEHAIAVTAVSSSYPRYELEKAKEIAACIGVTHVLAETKEVNNPNYMKNSPERCYFCKSTLYETLKRIAHEKQVPHIINGINLDDTTDFRPGMRAANEAHVLSPLKSAGLTKKEIRIISHSLGLPNWDKPASPCLSSRVPYGIAITPEILGKVEKAESVLREFGFTQFRVRYHKEIARIEVGKNDFLAVLEHGDEITKRIREIGFAYVCLDLRGFRSGSLNEVVVHETSKK